VSADPERQPPVTLVAIRMVRPAARATAAQRRTFSSNVSNCTSSVGADSGSGTFDDRYADGVSGVPTAVGGVTSGAKDLAAAERGVMTSIGASARNNALIAK
jgi:hypothetical protein